MAVTINGTTGIETNTDTGKVKVGQDDDLQIYHNGSDSYIQHGTTGNLRYQSGNHDFYNQAGDEFQCRMMQDDAVSLYHNGAKKFETHSGGINVTGSVNPSGNVKMPDNTGIKWGAGEDLNIYHQSSDDTNWIEQGNNTLTWKVNGTNNLQLENSTVFWSKDHRPWSNDSYDLGSTGSKWDDVYATNGTIQTSDRNEKNTIVDTDLGLSFVNKLKPVSYKFNGKTRTHYGLIAQDVETILSDISKSTTDFAGFIKTDLPDQVYDAIKDEGNIPEGKKAGDVKIPAYTTYGLRYSEFISPLIKAVQELSAEVETLKTKVAALESA